MRIIKNYNDFLNSTLINENLDKARKFLKDRYILSNAAKELGFIKGELEQQLKHDEIRSITMDKFTDEEKSELRKKMSEFKISDDVAKRLEKDPGFLGVRELKVPALDKNGKEVIGKDGKVKTFQLDRDHIGWLYSFTYFFYYENCDMETLKTIYSRLIQNKDILKNIKIDVDGDLINKEFDLNFINTNITNNHEKLLDGLDRLDTSRVVKRIENDLTRELKEDLKNENEAIKEKFEQICFAFSQLGMNDDGKVDIETNKLLYKGFFGGLQLDNNEYYLDGEKNPNFGKMRYMSKLSRYKNIRDFIKAAEGYIKSTSNSGFESFNKKMTDCNNKYGILGAEFITNEKGIVIIEVKSFQANVVLNAHTQHCIKDSNSQWDSYIGNHYNKQYYIYNFNLADYEKLSVIGITIEPGQKIRAAHDKQDGNVQYEIKSILSGWEKEYGIDEDLFSFLQPMTDAEIEKKEKAKIANRRLQESDLGLEELIKLIKEDGGDINTKNCIALKNAILENDIEKAKVIIDFGGNPNLESRGNEIINNVTSFDMLKIVVEGGGVMTKNAYLKIKDNLESVEFCLKNGLDPNFDSNTPFRRAFNMVESEKPYSLETYPKPNMDIINLLFKYSLKNYTVNKDNVKKESQVLARIAAVNCSIEVLDFLEKKGLIKNWVELIEMMPVPGTSKASPSFKPEVLVKYYTHCLEKAINLGQLKRVKSDDGINLAYNDEYCFQLDDILVDTFVTKIDGDEINVSHFEIM